MTHTNDDQLYMMFFGYSMLPDYLCTSTPEKPSEPSKDEQGSEDKQGFAPFKGLPRGGGARCGPQTDQDKGLMPAGDDRLQREWPKEDLVPLTAEQLMLYMPGYGWALRCIQTGEVYPMQWAPCTADDNKAVSNLASNMGEAFTEAWQGAKHVSGLPQQAAVLPCGDLKLQCTDVKVLMRGGEYDIVLTDTPHPIFCQFARPVTCIIATQKQLLAMSLAHNAAVALVKPQQETWYHENWKDGVSLTYDQYGCLKYGGDNHGFSNMSMTDITDMTDAKRLCSKTSPAKLQPLTCFTGKTVGSQYQDGPVMGSVSGLTAEVTNKKTNQTSITSVEGPPLLVAGHGLVVMVSLQAEMKVFGGNSECEICFELLNVDNPICLTSCGHAKVCRGCVMRIGHDTKKPCPMCRQDIHWAVEVKTGTTPEVEERPPKTAKLIFIESLPKLTSNGAAAGPSAVPPVSDDDDGEMRTDDGSRQSNSPTPPLLNEEDQALIDSLFQKIRDATPGANLNLHAEGFLWMLKTGSSEESIVQQFVINYIP